jgi:hypothetical protein
MDSYTLRFVHVYPEADGERGRFELGSNEQILDSEQRGTRVVLTVLTPVEATYYCGVNGCSREVDSADDRCWQHEESDN